MEECYFNLHSSSLECKQSRRPLYSAGTDHIINSSKKRCDNMHLDLQKKVRWLIRMWHLPVIDPVCLPIHPAHTSKCTWKDMAKLNVLHLRLHQKILPACPKINLYVYIQWWHANIEKKVRLEKETANRAFLSNTSATWGNWHRWMCHSLSYSLHFSGNGKRLGEWIVIVYSWQTEHKQCISRL